MQETINELNIFIEPKFPITKRGALNECEGIINICGQLVNYKKVSPALLRFSCIVMPGKLSVFIGSLDRNFKIKTDGQLQTVTAFNNAEALYIKLLLTVPVKVK